ncbi:MAG: hypothetical protein DRO06_02035, partial [Thermoproteota archaeon]
MEENRGDGQGPLIPPELIKFLELPWCHTMTIRGLPGTGKTALSLALAMEAVKRGMKPAYLS